MNNIGLGAGLVLLLKSFADRQQMSQRIFTIQLLVGIALSAVCLTVSYLFRNCNPQISEQPLSQVSRDTQTEATPPPPLPSQQAAPALQREPLAQPVEHVETVNFAWLREVQPAMICAPSANDWIVLSYRQQHFQIGLTLLRSNDFFGALLTDVSCYQRVQLDQLLTPDMVEKFDEVDVRLVLETIAGKPFPVRDSNGNVNFAVICQYFAIFDYIGLFEVLFAIIKESRGGLDRHMFETNKNNKDFLNFVSFVLNYHNKYNPHIRQSLINGLENYKIDSSNWQKVWVNNKTGVMTWSEQADSISLYLRAYPVENARLAISYRNGVEVKYVPSKGIRNVVTATLRFLRKHDEFFREASLFVKKKGNAEYIETHLDYRVLDNLKKLYEKFTKESTESKRQ